MHLYCFYFHFHYTNKIFHKHLQSLPNIPSCDFPILTKLNHFSVADYTKRYNFQQMLIML